MEFPAVRRELRVRYACDTCKAKEGVPCRTLTEPWRITDPHQSRWEQYARDQTNGTRRTRLSRPNVFSVTRQQLIDALLVEGWGEGFTESLVDRMLKRAVRATPREDG